MVYNITSGSDAPQAPVSGISKLQMLLIAIKYQIMSAIALDLISKMKAL